MNKEVTVQSVRTAQDATEETQTARSPRPDLRCSVARRPRIAGTRTVARARAGGGVGRSQSWLELSSLLGWVLRPRTGTSQQRVGRCVMSFADWYPIYVNSSQRQNKGRNHTGEKERDANTLFILKKQVPSRSAVDFSTFHVLRGRKGARERKCPRKCNSLRSCLFCGHV